MKKKLSPIKSGSLSSQAVNRIRDGILSGTYPPGEHLRELHLASELGVSQATVREALLHLERLGLVSRAPHRGTVVTKLSPREVQERVVIRAALEQMAAVQAAGHMTERDFDKLNEYLQRVPKATSNSGPSKESMEADLAFHRYIWDCSGNETLVHLLEHLVGPLFAFFYLVSRDPDNLIPDHQPIVKALRAGDPESIKRVIRKHIILAYAPYIPLAGEDSDGLDLF